MLLKLCIYEIVGGEMEEKRSLIETFLPVDEISAEAKKEKNGRAPTFELHFWWTRKPLVAARSTILGTLLPSEFDIKEFKRMLGLRDDQKRRAHNFNLTNSQLTLLHKNCKDLWGNETVKILDPFAGGGSIPFEALRVGCDVIANDYNPVAHLIEKATIEYPAVYGEKLLIDVEKGIDWVIKKTEDELKKFYPDHKGKKVSTYFHSWMVSCSNCGFKNPLVGQWWLVRVKNKNLYLKPHIKNNKLNFSIESGDKAPPASVTRGKGKCLNCGSVIEKDHIKKEILENEEEKLLAVVLLGDNGKEYDLPDEIDIKAIKDAEIHLENNLDSYLKEDLIAIEEMPDDLRGGIWAKLYLKYWYKNYNSRQRILFATLIRSIREYIDIISKKYDQEYTKAIATYLAILIGKQVDFNSRSTKYTRTREGISSSTSLRGVPIIWDHTEVNPFVKSSGTFHSIKRAILRSLDYSINNLNGNYEVNIQNKSITELNEKVKIIITDPPYFDDVQYAELSESFYIMEKRALNGLLELPDETPKSEDLSVGGKRQKEVFENLFNISCKKMHSMLSDDGILVMYFAHSTINAWDFVVNALRDSKFQITATWPIHTESTTNPLAMGHSSIMSSIVLVARKRLQDKSGFVEEIKEELGIHLKEKLNNFWDYNLRGADITVAAMGATLDILTQYSNIKSYTGEMTVKDILELVEVFVVEFILEKFLKDSESLDSSTRFYVYCRLSELDGMSFDTANLISKSLHIDLHSLETAGIIKSLTTGRNKGIKLLKFDEREIIEGKNLIDVVQLAMLSYEKGGIREFESFIKDTRYTQREIYNLLESFKHLDSGDPEKQIAMQILGKSEDILPKKGQTTFE